jgi:hypothetical protein
MKFWRDPTRRLLWAEPPREEFYYDAAGKMCEGIAARFGVVDAYPAKFRLPTSGEFHDASVRGVKDAIWMFWSMFWTSTPSVAASGEAVYWDSLSDAFGSLNPRHSRHWGNRLRALCVADLATAIAIE